MESATTVARKSKRSEITGRVCETYNLDQLYKVKIELGIKNPKEKQKKDILCMEIEFFFRLKNREDPSKIWFVGLE